jgi:hypothetical protein
MNRGCGLLAIGAAAAAALASPASARDAPAAALSIDPIVARGLLAPVEEGAALSSYRLDPGLDPANGQRVRLSIDLGSATMFAITGRLQRLPAASGPLDSAHARLLGQHHDSGKIYGAGVSATFRGVDLSAAYQYSKLRAEQGDTDMLDGGPGRSHSLRATARLKFRR